MRKILVLILSVFTCSLVYAETVTLKDGSIIKGEILNSNADVVELKTAFGNVKVERANIKSIDSGLYVIKLKDGTVINSKITERTNEYIKAELYGKEIKIPLENVVSAEPQSKGANAPTAQAKTSPAPSSGDGFFTPLSAGAGAAAAGTLSTPRALPETSAAAQAIYSGQQLPAQTGALMSRDLPVAGLADSQVSMTELTPESLATQVNVGDTSSQMKYLITLKSGRQITATITDMTADSISIMTEDGEKTLLRSAILSVIAQQSPAQYAVKKQYVPTHIVTLKSGSKITCTVLEEGLTKIKIATEYGTNEILKNTIFKIEEIDKDNQSPKVEKPRKIKRKEPKRIRAKETKWDREFSVFVGLWKSPLKLDLSEKGGPENFSLEGSGVTYGVRYMFYRTGVLHMGVSGALFSVPNKEFEISPTEVISVSGEAGYIEANAYFGANVAKVDGVYLVAGAGLSMTKLTTKIDDGVEIESESISQTQPIFSLGAGVNKKFSSTILGLEARWSYVKQNEETLSSSSSGFLSILARIVWRFD